MCTPTSIEQVEDFLRDAALAHIYNVTFQTYIPNGRAKSDLGNMLSNVPAQIQRLRRITELFAPDFLGGLKVHDFSQDYWYLVLDEQGRLTLPSTTRADHIMGHISDKYLDLPQQSNLPANNALELIWNRKAYGPGIVSL